MSVRGRRITILAVLCAIAVAVVAIAIASSGGSSDKPKVTKKKGETSVEDALFAGIAQDGLALGKPGAPLTIEEYVDPQCPFCAEFSRDVLPTVLQRYVRPGRLRIVLRPLTFIGDDSLTAARMVAAVSQQNRAWQFIDGIYANQGAENSGYVTDAYLRQIGALVSGLDVDRALAARTDPSVKQLLREANRRAGRYGADSTPSFLVVKPGAKPRLLETDNTLASFTQAVDALL